MKKVLTLMGALSVAGSAIAHDYLWNMSDLSGKSWTEGFNYNSVLDYIGDENSSFNNKVLGVVSSVKGSDSNNCFKFSVQPGDIVTVHAITVENNTGKVYMKDQNGLETNADIDNSGSTVLTVTTSSSLGGEVYVYADANVAITKITVVSAKYNEVMAKIKDARKEVDEAKKQIASYVTKYPNFYSAITRQISLQVSNEIIDIEKQLAEDAKNNNVSSGTQTGDALIAHLDALVNPSTGVLKGILNDAAAAKDAYEVNFLGGTPLANAKAAIELAYKEEPTQAEASGYTIKKVKEFEEDGVTPKTWEDKAVGLRAYMNNMAKKYYENAQQAAKDSLNGFPWAASTGAYPLTACNDSIQRTVDYVHNIIDRFVYEKENATKFASLRNDANTTASHISTTGLQAPLGFDDLKNDIFNLYNLLNKTDNKEVFSRTEIYGSVFANPLTQYTTDLTSARTNLMNQAKTKQDEACDGVQTALVQYSAKITEQFTGQPEAQAEYEQKFAQLQVRLDKIYAYNTYEQRVAKFGEVSVEIAKIRTDVEEIWQGAQTAQNSEIIAQNNANKTKLDEEIVKALEFFNEGVNKINGYKQIDGISSDEELSKAIDAELIKVFDYAANIEKAKNEAAKAVLDANTSAPAVSFDYDKYSTIVSTAVSNIEQAISDARAQANDAAFSYLKNGKKSQWGYGYTPVAGTLAWSSNQIDYAKEILTLEEDYFNYQNSFAYVYRSLKTSDLAAQALNKIDSLQYSKFTSGGEYIKGTGIYEQTSNYVSLHNQNTFVEDGVTKQRDIADCIEVVKNRLYPVIDNKLDDILKRVKGYEDSKADIDQLKIRWSVAKANIDADYAEDIIVRLNKINDDVNALLTKLQGYAFDAIDHKAEIDEELARLNDELWIAENYKTYLANEAALKTVNDAIAGVQQEIVDAKAEVAKLDVAEVVEEYTAQLDEISFADVEEARDSYYENHTLNSNAQSIVDNDLAAISTAVAQIVSDAQAANQLVHDNDTALVNFNAALDSVKLELTDAKAEVAKLVTPEVIEEFAALLDNISFVAIEEKRDEHYAAKELSDEEVLKGLNDELAAISAEIAQIVEDAKAADKAAQEVPGDVNGDKALDALDFEIIEEFVVNGVSEDEAEDIKAMREQSDLNNDGKVDTRDLNEFLKLYRNK